MAAESPINATGFKARLTRVLRSKPSRSRLTKKPPPGHGAQDARPDVPAVPSELQAHRDKYKDATAIDSQLGERRDNTAMLHSLVHVDSFESIKDAHRQSYVTSRTPGERMISSLPSPIWEIIANYVTPCDVANLAFSNKTLRCLLESSAWDDLRRPENFQYRIEFLVPMDHSLPNHLFCFLCATYHLRVQRGQERLKGPKFINPLFNCPNADVPAPYLRTRLTPGRTLPFAFVQLATRAERDSPDYGVSVDSMSRRWKEENWSHLTQYCIHNGHLLMRVVSSCFAPPGLPLSGQRMLLYSREDYTPYFSVCAHWRDGKLMNLCKCALGHIPVPRDEGGLAGIGMKVRDKANHRKYNHNALVTLCQECRPMRRCPECPSEYLIEIKLAEDTSDNTFKKAIVVTRWSDLGTGMSPFSSEWAACNGEAIAYDSFAAVGKRAISGTFEAHFTDDHIPGQRILSMNPKNEKRGEAGHNWY
ncbi:MAG: hypothetical protein M1818_005762 [Claussenomyces sp. TS43310]|nr:MAG: hypothetical protein M1818_005762 [Claussenomyces sp. TS43310]